MEYNLGELLPTKSIKQVTSMLKVRHDRELAASEYVSKYDNYPYDDMPKYISGLKKANKTVDDCRAWLNDAVHYFSEDLWNKMIVDAGYCMEGNDYEDLMECQ